MSSNSEKKVNDRHCFVPECKTGCKNFRGKNSLYKAPDNDELRAKWTKLIPRADKVLNKNSVEPRYSRSFRPGMDVNLYATKKSVAQGMMDIALLTANASQFKYILKEGDDSKFYLVNVICIGISIALQLIVGVLLILNTRYNINMVSHQSRAELINNLTIIGIFLITVSNVFVSAFGTSPR